MATPIDRSCPDAGDGDSTDHDHDPFLAAAAAAQGHDSRTDDDLVHDFLDGDSAAFRLIVERHRARLIHVARKYAANEDDAQDIMQEAWFKASFSLRTFRSESTLKTWLYRVVTNKGNDFITHRSRRELATLDEDNSPLQRSPQLIVDPYDQADHAMLVQQVLALLPEHQRTALILVDMLGHDLDSAATHLGVRSGTLKSRRARARAALREQVTPES